MLALGFLTLGALVMHGSGEQLAPQGAVFANQIIDIYVRTLGEWSRPIIGIAAFTTMFSTTLTVTDAFPRVLQRSTEIIFKLSENNSSRNDTRSDFIYWGWMGIIVIGGLSVIGSMMHRMTFLVDVATTLSFLTAPVLAFMNYSVVTGPTMPDRAKPGKFLRILSWIGIIFLGGFSIFFLVWKFTSGLLF